MRKNKTSSSPEVRATYIYYDLSGKKLLELKPGKDGVTETDITMLHKADDNEFDAQRREDYHIPARYDAYTDENNDDKNSYISDNSTNPESILIRAKYRSDFKLMWEKLLPNQQELVIKKLAGRSNTDIAAEDGVTEGAIRDRIRKIQKKFKNFL